MTRKGRCSFSYDCKNEDGLNKDFKNHITETALELHTITFTNPFLNSLKETVLNKTAQKIRITLLTRYDCYGFDENITLLEIEK